MGVFDKMIENLKDEEFILKAASKLETENKVRAVKLENGLVFTHSELGQFMYEDKILYEVEFGGYEIEPCINPYWNKVGKSYTLDEFQKLVNKGDI